VGGKLVSTVLKSATSTQWESPALQTPFATFFVATITIHLPLHLSLRKLVDVPQQAWHTRQQVALHSVHGLVLFLSIVVISSHQGSSQRTARQIVAASSRPTHPSKCATPWTHNVRKWESRSRPAVKRTRAQRWRMQLRTAFRGSHQPCSLHTSCTYGKHMMRLPRS